MSRENCSLLISLTLYCNASKFCSSRKTECKRNALFPSRPEGNCQNSFLRHPWDERVFVFQCKTVVYLLRRVDIYIIESSGRKACNPLSQCLLLRLLLPSILLLSAIRQSILYLFYKPVHVRCWAEWPTQIYLWTVYITCKLILILHTLKNNHWSQWFASLRHQDYSLYHYLIIVKCDP